MRASALNTWEKEICAAKIILFNFAEISKHAANGHSRFSHVGSLQSKRQNFFCSLTLRRRFA
jgi:hypothetical protein